MDNNSNEIEPVDNAAHSHLVENCVNSASPSHVSNRGDRPATDNVDHQNNKHGHSRASVGRGDSPSVTNHNDSLAKDDARASIDPQKSKERDERLRLARERREEAERRRLDELREAMSRQQEARKRQEEERKRKIEEMKKREEEHRNIVEERRKRLLDEENERRQAILRRTAERDARLELMKPVKRSPITTAFGGYYSSAASSSQNILSPGSAALRRSAVSTRDVFRTGEGAVGGDGAAAADLQDAGSAAVLKRLSVSTGHLGARKPVRDKTPSAAVPDAAASGADVEDGDKEDKEGDDGKIYQSMCEFHHSTCSPFQSCTCK